jgi:hypothetical protein
MRSFIMPEIHGPQVGHFCWYELGTTNQTAAKTFYSSLFGWTPVDHPMGPDATYTIFQLGGRDVGAVYTLTEKQQGVPPHWMTYVAVASADEIAAKAAALGGTVVAPPFDVFDIGRMAVILDPTGATIAVWQAKQRFGVGIAREPNAFCWSEIATRDTAAAGKFYSALFGWGMKVTDTSGFPYTHWQVGGLDIGGMMGMDERWGSIPSHWMNYISVTDCDAVVSKACPLGATVCVPPTSIPEVGRFSVLQDPQGATFSVIALRPMDKG